MPRKKIIDPAKPPIPRVKSKDGAKRGPFSAEEKAYMNSNFRRLTADVMATKLKRTPESVRVYLEEHLSVVGDGVSPVIRQLRESSDYAKWQQQFLHDEMRQLENRYVELMGQFQNDVKKTDEIHIFQLISNEIQLDRILIEQKQTVELQRSLHEKINKLSLKEDPSDRDMAMLDRYQVEFENAKANAKVLTDRQKIFQERMDKAMQALKATRDQRMKNAMDKGRNITELIKFLMDEENRRAAGEEMALRKVAMDEEYKRLGKPVKYANGEIDHPIFNYETIDIESEEEDE